MYYKNILINFSTFHASYNTYTILRNGFRLQLIYSDVSCLYVNALTCSDLAHANNVAPFKLRKVIDTFNLLLESDFAIFMK